MRTSLLVLTVALALIASTSANSFAKRFHANTSKLANTTSIRIPDYGNHVPRVVNCSKNASYCSGADNRSTVTIPHIHAYNLSYTVNSSGSGVLNGNLEFIYNATFVNGTANATIINGWNYMYFTGKVSKTGVNGTLAVEVEPYSLPHVSNDNNSFVFYAAQKLFYNVYSYEVQRYVNKFFQPNTTNSTNTTATLSIPNYANATVKSINCSSNWWTCSGANRSALNTSNVESKNLSITIDTISGSGYLNGYLIVPYSAHLINTTSNADIQESLDSAYKGQANLTIYGKVERTGASGIFRVEVEPTVYGNVTLDRNYFAVNAVKDLYYNQYSWELQQHINAYFQNNTLLAKTHASIKGKVLSL